MLEWYGEDLTRQIINAAYRVNDHLRSRPGYRESNYREALNLELQRRGLKTECPAPHPRLYLSQRIGHGRADLLVEDRIVVLVKCVEKVNQRHVDLHWTYLLDGHWPVGLVALFNGGARPLIMRKYNGQAVEG
jgi:GxxExxY protein